MKTQKKQTTENYIKEVRRKTKRIFSSEQKIQIVMLLICFLLNWSMILT